MDKHTLTTVPSALIEPQITCNRNAAVYASLPSRTTEHSRGVSSTAHVSHVEGRLFESQPNQIPSLTKLMVAG